MKIALVLLLLSGCDKLFGITPVGTGSSGSGVIDALPPEAPPIIDGPVDMPWVCAPAPVLTMWNGSNFSVVGTYPTTSHPTADVTMLKFYFATAGDIEQCDIGTNNLRNASNCSVVTSISGVSAETAPSLSADNMTMYLDRAGVPMQSTRATGNTWLNAATMILPGRLASAEVGATSMETTHGMRMLLSDGSDILEASYSGSTGWVEIQGSLSRVSTIEAHEVDPYLSPDGCWMVYASDAAAQSPKNYDLYYATRESDGTFTAGTPLTNINNDVTDDRGPFVANGQILYYTRGNNLEVAEPP